MAGGPLVYRYPTARATTIVGVSATAVALVAALFVPSRDAATFLPLVAAGAWIAWVMWGYPFLRLDERGITVRNSFSTVEIPLTAVVEITAGSKLTIRTADHRTYIPVAAPGSGVSFFWRAQRAKDAYGDSIVPIKGVDALRLDAFRERTPATVIADTISRRIDQLGPRAAGPRSVPPPHINVEIIVGTMVVLGVSAALLLIVL